MDFSDLLRAAKTGDHDARAELHRRFVPHVLVRVRRRLTPALRRKYDTLDVGQSVFVELLDHLETFEDRGETAFRHWLLRTAENKVRSKLRKARGRNGLRENPLDDELTGSLPVPEPGPAEWSEAREDLRRLNRLVAGLASDERRLLVLRSQERRSFKEIASEIDGASPDAVRVRYARLLSRLQERWRET